MWYSVSPWTGSFGVLLVILGFSGPCYKKHPKWKWQKNELSILTQRWIIGQVMYPTPIWVLVTKVGENWSLPKTCQREVCEADRADRFSANFNSLQLSDQDSKLCWVENESNYFIFERVSKWFFCHFYEGCFVCIAPRGMDTKVRVLVLKCAK